MGSKMPDSIYREKREKEEILRDGFIPLMWVAGRGIRRATLLDQAFSKVLQRDSEDIQDAGEFLVAVIIDADGAATLSSIGLRAR